MDNNIVVNSICAKAASLHSYEYVINNNANNRHWTDKEELYRIISPFFSDNPRKLLKISNLIKDFQSFEVKTKEQKIFLLKNDTKQEIKNLRKDKLRKYLSLDEFKKLR